MNGTDRASRGTGAERDGSGSTPVSPLMIPLLVAGLAIGFLAGYFLLWWGALVVLAGVVAAIAPVLRGRRRAGATGAIAGVLLGYAGVILVALFRGVV